MKIFLEAEPWENFESGQQCRRTKTSKNNVFRWTGEIGGHFSIYLYAPVRLHDFMDEFTLWFPGIRKIHWVTNIPKYSLDHSTNVDNWFRFRKAMITFAFFITNIELFCLHCKWLGWLFHQNDKEYKNNSMKLMVKKMKNKN